MRRRTAFLLLGCVLVGARAALADPSALEQAMRDELARSASELAMPDAARPYYIHTRALDHDSWTFRATLGALTQEDHSRSRLVRTQLRVGTHEEDNGNIVTGEFTDVYAPAARLPLDDDYWAMRRALWLETDAVYKQAAEVYEKKRAASLERSASTDHAPDFSEVSPVTTEAPLLAEADGADELRRYVQETSAIFTKYPTLRSSFVEGAVATTNTLYIDTDGSVARYPRRLVRIDIVCSAQAEDGAVVSSFRTVAGPSVKALPPLEEVKETARSVATEALALAAAPTVEGFVGPVLFDGMAGPQLVRDWLLPHLSGTPAAASSESARDSFVQRITERGSSGASDWAPLIGQQVASPGLTIRDDPTATSLEGQHLLGGYPADDEGVPSREVIVVENGKLRTLLMSRIPSRDIPESNGHGRASLLLQPRGHASNVIVEATLPLRARDMKQRLLAEMRKTGAAHGLIVRRLDVPTVTQPELSYELREARQGKLVPLVAYRVDASGKEELVRGASLEVPPAGTLRDLCAVGAEGPVVHDFAAVRQGDSALAWAGMMPTSVASPSLLLPQLSVVPSHEVQPKRPAAPSPLNVSTP